MDGYLKIKTKIDNKEVDKGIKELEDKIKKLQTDNSQNSNDQRSLQQEIDNYEQMCQKADQYKQKIKELEIEKDKIFKQNPNLAVSTDSAEYANIKAQISEIQAKYAQTTAEIDKQAPKIDKVYSKLESVKKKQEENNAKISEYKRKIESINTDKIKNSLDSVGNKLTSQIGKLGKMAFAIIGIRTAWGLVRSAISTVAQYNPQIATDIAYIQYALANTLLPVVQKLISLAYTLLSYINAITSAWFGINLFGNSSAKNFQKMQKSASGTAKSAKEIQKSLQGFDEMNIIQDNNSSNGGESGASMPSMDLNGIQGEVPKWLKWIIDNKDLMLSILAGILAGIVAIKLGLGLIKALGIGVLIAGIVFMIQNLIKYFKDPSWTNFGKIIQGIGIALIGLGIIIGSIPVAIAGAITLIVGMIVKYWEQIKAFFQKGIDWLTSKSDWVHNMFGDTIGNIYDMFVYNLQQLLNFFDSIFKMIKGIFDGIITFIKGVFTGNWKQAWEGIKQIFVSVFEGIKGVFIAIFNSIRSQVVTIASTTGTIISNVFKAVVNAVLRTIENVLNSPIRAVNALIGVINKVPGINITRLNTFNLPRLARGGIISQPTQAIIGEAGKEAVVPLENNLEWLDKLSDMISSKIGGNGNVNVYLDGRLIQRQMSKRNDELAFATNR